MNFKINLVTVFICYTLITLFSFCDPNQHNPSESPCNFPDLDTEINLRNPQWFKIIDSKTSMNLVGFGDASIIHKDSVFLYDNELQEIPSSSTYYIDNWIFTNLQPYWNVPFNDAQALLNLDERVFYLRVAYNDIDTIKIVYKQCLVFDIFYNGRDTKKPESEPYFGSATFYFKK